MPKLKKPLLHAIAVKFNLSDHLCLMAFCCAVGMVMERAQGQQLASGGNGVSALQSDPIVKVWGDNSEVRKCGICHYSSGNVFAKRDTDFCQLEEAKIWLQSDKHAVSRLRIEPLSPDELVQMKRETGDSFGLGESNVVSYKLCQQLGYDVTTKAGYEKFRDNCLTCHAGYDPEQPKSSEDFTSSNKHHPGITCNYCHQLGEVSRWVDVHGGLSTELNWRLMSPQEKETVGMRDLVDAQAQAQLCASCHIGDHKRKMFVTHAMYVAGHPPLPSFELQTYVSNLPAHWRDLSSTYASLKNYSQRDAYFAVNLGIPKEHIPRVVADSFWETRTMLLGALQAAEQSISLLADASEDQHWGDYALYDCASCHHELRLPSLRQKRAAHEVPGRPRLFEWPTPLVEVAVQLVGPEQGVKQARQELLKLVNQTPFGNPNDCLPAALALMEALKETRSQLVKSSVHAEHAQQVLKLLAHTSDDSLLDYHAARQVIWAIQLVDRELASKGQALPDSSRALIGVLGSQAQQSLVSTILPAGRSGTLYTPAQSPVGTERLSYLAAELQRLRAYDPQKMQTQLHELCIQLD